jgi:hypothetical protein
VTIPSPTPDAVRFCGSEAAYEQLMLEVVAWGVSEADLQQYADVLSLQGAADIAGASAAASRISDSVLRHGALENLAGGR